MSYLIFPKTERRAWALEIVFYVFHFQKAKIPFSLQPYCVCVCMCVFTYAHTSTCVMSPPNYTKFRTSAATYRLPSPSAFLKDISISDDHGDDNEPINIGY